LLLKCRFLLSDPFPIEVFKERKLPENIPVAPLEFTILSFFFFLFFARRDGFLSDW